MFHAQKTVVKAPRSGCSSEVGSELGALETVSVEKAGEMGMETRELVEAVSLGMI